MQKPINVIIGLPAQRGQLEPECFSSLYAARRRLYEQGIVHNILGNQCSVISAGRNGIVQEFLNKTNADYLMFVDSDTQFPVWGIQRLISRNVDVIGGIYYHKEGSHSPTIYKLREDGFFRSYSEFDIFDEPFEVDGIGTGFLLIKRAVLERFTPDVVKLIGTPFGFGYAPDGVEEGEDLSFCRRIKKLGVKVWADPTIMLGHVGTAVYTRADFDTFAQFEAWKKRSEVYDNDIDGWMTKTELNWLFQKSKDMESVVELGCWKGRSTHAIASGCPGHVITVDTFKGTAGEPGNPFIDAESQDILAEHLLPNVSQFENLDVWNMTTLEAAELVEDKSIDMVFIDANHTYEAVRDDIAAWLPKVKKIISGHDFQWPGVQEAVTEMFGEPLTAGTIWYVDVTRKRQPGEMSLDRLSSIKVPII